MNLIINFVKAFAKYKYGYICYQEKVIVSENKCVIKIIGPELFVCRDERYQNRHCGMQNWYHC
jgi:uncharacterized beta-barrel protein YwiB (DUF1934 family)